MSASQKLQLQALESQVTQLRSQMDLLLSWIGLKFADETEFPIPTELYPVAFHHFETEEADVDLDLETELLGFDELDPENDDIFSSKTPQIKASNPSVSRRTRSLSRADCSSHVKAQYGENCYKCPEPGCGQTFIKEEHLKRHLIRGHQHRHTSNAPSPTTATVTLGNTDTDTTNELRINPDIFIKEEPLDSKDVDEDQEENNYINCNNNHELFSENDNDDENYYSPSPDADTNNFYDSDSSDSTYSDRPKFACPQPNCGKIYRRKSHLTRHKKTVHSKFKSATITCEICAKVFTRMEHLNRHRLTIHAGIKPYMCEICGKGFGRMDSLKDHSRVHSSASQIRKITNKLKRKVHAQKEISNSKPEGTENSNTKGLKYQCDICSKYFTTKPHLTRHKKTLHSDSTIITSTPVKPAKYNCDQCGRGFTENHHLRRHVRTVHEDTKYICTICERAFSRKDNLNEHCFRVHSSGTRSTSTTKRKAHEEISDKEVEDDQEIEQVD